MRSSPCRLSVFRFLRPGLYGHRRRAGRMAKQLETRKILKLGTALELFALSMLKYGLLDSDAIAESLSKVGKCQDRTSEIPAGGPMVVQLLWPLGKGFATGLNVNEGGGNSDEGKRKTYNGDSAAILSPLRGWVLCQWKETHRIWMATYHCVAVNAFSPN